MSAEWKICPKCGTEMLKKSKTCPFCGHNFDDEISQAETDNDCLNIEKPKSKDFDSEITKSNDTSDDAWVNAWYDRARRAKIIWIVTPFAFLVAGIILAIVLSKSSGGSSDAVLQFAVIYVMFIWLVLLISSIRLIYGFNIVVKEIDGMKVLAYHFFSCRLIIDGVECHGDIEKEYRGIGKSRRLVRTNLFYSVPKKRDFSIDFYPNGTINIF